MDAVQSGDSLKPIWTSAFNEKEDPCSITQDPLLQIHRCCRLLPSSSAVRPALHARFLQVPVGSAHPGAQAQKGCDRLRHAARPWDRITGDRSATEVALRAQGGCLSANHLLPDAPVLRGHTATHRPCLRASSSRCSLASKRLSRRVRRAAPLSRSLSVYDGVRSWGTQRPPDITDQMNPRSCTSRTTSGKNPEVPVGTAFTWAVVICFLHTVAICLLFAQPRLTRARMTDNGRCRLYGKS